jgi:hypothetical protein
MAKRDSASLDPVQAAAKKLFLERLERQRAEREEQARHQVRARFSVPEEEDQPPRRDWSQVIDRDGRVRWQQP